jgi:predicted NAD-dependent protein-ADP-ribosyltransferase YbiA (DUF1768 family)
MYMVKSILDSTLDYSESAKIDPTDLEYDASLYETTIYDKDVIFALGKPKYTYIDNNIIYYSIYLVENEEITIQIGVYEILASEQENILDVNGEIDLNKFDEPLLFAFTYEKLRSGATKGKTPAQNKTSQKKSKWIKEFMANDKYDIIDTKYDGNCFFSMIQFALEENGQEASIEEMREILVENANEELFQNYKTLYDNYVSAEANLTRELKNITKRHKDLTATLKKTKDRNLISSYEKQSTEIEDIHKTVKIDRRQVREALEEYAFMKGIDNLSMLKLKMKTSEYWADTWAISTLERELNIKTILFSELNYREHDIINVLQCGQLNDTVLEERGIFEPSFYILGAYHGGYHYQMITYNEQKAFSFEELPEEIRHLVSEKCLEKIAGPYSLIPEFKDYALKMKTRVEPIIISSDKSSSKTVTPVSKEPVEELSSDLYDSGTVFRFYGNSLDKPRPGHGAGETLGSDDDKTYEDLARIPQWRKKLANSWPAEFKIDNHTWLSVEHYYQAAKFKRNNKDFYIQFSLDSPDSSIAKNTDLAKAAGGKSGKFKGEVVRPKNVVIDSDFYQKPAGVKFSRGEIEMETAMRAKFTQHPDLKQLLLATKKAKLEHITRGKPAIVFNDLMRVRRELKEVL